ncbi:DotU family type IV/VI secretion system protein [Desulfonatronum thioautotrophicum]|uniref:DotU family type IV/VI secretion system protein n=1 Tax=Desulfonatronum thioautotrophicum TaxID=617001 RepID=UPI00069A3E4A|nr:DotU family type IV/VI secretion system protein [Desulfonatronum thioautotrophicum]
MALIDDFLPALAFAAMLGSEPNLADTPYATARADMDRLLQQGMDRAYRRDTAQAEQALFAVCAFADEAVLASSWPGRTEWMRNKLQQVHFHTVNAGEEFYKRLAGLCGKSAREPLDMSLFENLEQSPVSAQRDVLEVYVACLTLGFTGRYFGPEGRSTLQELTKANLENLQSGRQLSEERLFPEVYEREISKSRTELFAPSLQLILLFTVPAVLALGIYLAYAAMLSDFVATWLGALG